jgi:hypothetical protein
MRPFVNHESANPESDHVQLKRPVSLESLAAVNFASEIGLDIDVGFSSKGGAGRASA